MGRVGCDKGGSRGEGGEGRVGVDVELGRVRFLDGADSRRYGWGDRRDGAEDRQGLTLRTSAVL